MSVLRACHFYHQGNTLGTHFYYRLSEPQGSWCGQKNWINGENLWPNQGIIFKWSYTFTTNTRNDIQYIYYTFFNRPSTIHLHTHSNSLLAYCALPLVNYIVSYFGYSRPLKSHERFPAETFSKQVTSWTGTSWLVNFPWEPPIRRQDYFIMNLICYILL